MKKILVAFLLLAVPALAAPTKPVVSSSGTVSNGQTFTILVSGEGTKSPAPPMVWDQFEYGTHMTPITDDPGGPTYVGYGTPATSPYFLNTESHSGSMSAGNTTPRQGIMGSCNILGLSSTDEVFISLWHRQTNVDAGESGTVKLMRVVDDSNHYNGAGVWGLGGKGISSAIKPNGTTNQTYTHDDGTGQNPSTENQYVDWFEDRWARLSLYCKAGTAGSNNAVQWHEGLSPDTPLASDSGLTDRRDGLMTMPASGYGPYVWSRVWIGMIATTTSGSYEQYMDDLYIDNTFARIELGDASTYGACTHMELQPPLTWGGSGTITATINTGSFSDGDVAYLYVIDANRGVSPASDPMTIDSVIVGCDGDVTAPAAPASMSASVPAANTISLSWPAVADTDGDFSAYRIYRGQASGSLSYHSSTTNTSYTNTGLIAGVTYYYAVRSADTCGNTSALTSEASATATGTPETPTTITSPTNLEVIE